MTSQWLKNLYQTFETCLKERISWLDTSLPLEDEKTLHTTYFTEQFCCMNADESSRSRALQLDIRQSICFRFTCDNVPAGALKYIVHFFKLCNDIYLRKILFFFFKNVWWKLSLKITISSEHFKYIFDI